MNSKWAFIGGMLAGIAGVFTAATIAVELKKKKSSPLPLEGKGPLALPEGGGK